jgi:hypothetical protein
MEDAISSRGDMLKNRVPFKYKDAACFGLQVATVNRVGERSK